MSSQTIKERLPLGGIDTGKAATWLSLSWKKLLSRKKQLILGGSALAILVVAGYHFWGGQSSAPQYMTAKVERGNLRNTVTATGTLQAVTTVQVGSQASGTISRASVSAPRTMSDRASSAGSVRRYFSMKASKEQRSP